MKDFQCSTCPVVFQARGYKGPAPKFCGECNHKRRLILYARYRAANLEAEREKDRIAAKKRRAANPELARARANASRKRWRLENPELAKLLSREQARVYRQRHPEKMKAATDRWILNNPHKVAEKQRRRKSRLLGLNAPGVTPDEWKTICEEFDHRCAYCLNPASHMDHVIPLAQGGFHEPGNVVPACKPCNSSKGAKSLPIWLITPRVSPAGVIAA